MPYRCFLRTRSPGCRATKSARQPDIAEHRLPQDGQFTLNLAGRPVSFRIATLPCRHGEKIVLRLLHQVEQALDLEALGLSSDQRRFARPSTSRRVCCWSPAQPEAVKPLPLSALQTRNHDAVNICSVEDPLEIPIAGMNQTQINPRRADLSKRSARPVTPGS
jgi:protein transport protein HofB